MQARLSSSEITHPGADLVLRWGRQHQCVALARAVHGPAESKTQSMYANAHCTETGRARKRPSVVLRKVRSGKGLRPQSRHAREREVGHGGSICEADEQMCTTGITRPTTCGVRGEK